MALIPVSTILKAGISKKFIGKTLKDLDRNDQNKIQLIKYMQLLRIKKAKGKGLFLCGNGRCGKSLVANIIAQSVMAYAFNVRVMSLSMLTSYYFGDDDTKINSMRLDDATFGEVIRTDFLIIDDIGDKIKPINQGSVRCLYETLNFRDKAMLPIIITSRSPIITSADKDTEDIKQLFSPFISEILKGNCTQIRLDVKKGD